MKTSPLKSLLLTLWFVLLLISCSSSGGIGGSGVTSQGSVSEFGSIFVNGTEFDTSNAAIIINGVEIGIGFGRSFLLEFREQWGVDVTLYVKKGDTYEFLAAAGEAERRRLHGAVPSFSEKPALRALIIDALPSRSPTLTFMEVPDRESRKF